jgi:hypothetical protein
LSGCSLFLFLLEKINRADERTMIKKRRKAIIAKNKTRNVMTSLVIFSPVPEYYPLINAPWPLRLGISYPWDRWIRYA